MDVMRLKGPFFQTIVQKVIRKAIKKKGVVAQELTVGNFELDMNDWGASFSITISGRLDPKNSDNVKKMILEEVFK